MVDHAVDAHLGRLTGRSCDSQVRTNSGPDLKLFWGFLLFSINRDLNPFLGVKDFWREFFREPIVIHLYLLGL